jgi:ribosomal protein L9
MMSPAFALPLNDGSKSAKSSGTIAEALIHKGYTIDKRNILLEEPIKEIGSQTVDIKLAGNVMAHISVTVIKDEA